MMADSSQSSLRTGNIALSVKLGKPMARGYLVIPEELRPFISQESWTSFCDACDRLSLDPVVRYGTCLLRSTFAVAVTCLVVVIVFGYLLQEQDDDNEDDKEDAEGISTVTILLVALPVLFPFVVAALLNCHAAAVMGRIVASCRANGDTWAAHMPECRVCTVERLESVSQTTEEVSQVVTIRFSSPLYSLLEDGILQKPSRRDDASLGRP